MLKKLFPFLDWRFSREDFRAGLLVGFFRLTVVANFLSKPAKDGFVHAVPGGVTA
ncbi:MAG: hypothetical protein K9M45_10310 [Kiritimatiellales bacterium]|nr:hypothetical protein [Kiritimatiellales bacterium]